MDDDEIDLTNPDDVRLWTDSLGVTEEELRAAVEAVGRSAPRIQQYLAPHMPLLGA